eukprot:gene10346-12059_t
MKQLLIWTLFGMIVSVPMAVQASDGAEALARWQHSLSTVRLAVIQGPRQIASDEPVPGELQSVQSEVTSSV